MVLLPAKECPIFEDRHLVLNAAPFALQDARVHSTHRRDLSPAGAQLRPWQLAQADGALRR